MRKVGLLKNSPIFFVECVPGVRIFSFLRFFLQNPRVYACRRINNVGKSGKKSLRALDGRRKKCYDYSMEYHTVICLLIAKKRTDKNIFKGEIREKGVCGVGIAVGIRQRRPTNR